MLSIHNSPPDFCIKKSISALIYSFLVGTNKIRGVLPLDAQGSYRGINEFHERVSMKYSPFHASRKKVQKSLK